jgi:hypothetical protein
VQRKQLHKTIQGTESKSTKPSASPSPPKEATTKQQNKNKEEEQQAVEEKLEKFSLDDTQKTSPTTRSPHEPSGISTFVDKSPTVTRDQERIQSDDGQDSSSSKDVEQPTTTATGDEVEQGASGGGGEEEEGEGEKGESEDQEELKVKVEETEEQLMKRFERMQLESQETQETIKRMTGYLKALDVASDEISPTDEGASPQPETQGAGDDDIGATGGTAGSASVMVGDCMDPIAQAALLASIKERTTTIDTTSASSQPQEEAGEIMEPVQVSETDPNNIVIVGEIVGGAQIVPSKSTPDEDSDTHPAASETTAEDPKLEYSGSDDLIGQTARESVDENSGDTPAAPKTEASRQDSSVEDQGSKEEDDGERRGEGSKAAAGAIEAPPSSFHSPSKKPKRQLAASFMNITKE